MLSVKQGGIKNHFLSLWYDSTWDWTKVSQAIGEHSPHYTNVSYIISNTWNDLSLYKQMSSNSFKLYIYIYIYIYTSCTRPRDAVAQFV